MKYNKRKSTTAVSQSKLNRRLIIFIDISISFVHFVIIYSSANLSHPNENASFFRRLLQSLFQIDLQNDRLCTCQSLNRNTNALTNDNDNQQVYPHMRKVYDDDTDLLEHVHIIMSTIKPDYSIQEQEESMEQRRRRRARVSKQRAKVLITEYCSRKIVDKIKISANKRNYSSLCFSFNNPLRIC